jgi:hypothetical protein
MCTGIGHCGEPYLMLWEWETPEDFRGLDPTRAGVAYLSRELVLGSNLEMRPRHQQLLLPANVFHTVGQSEYIVHRRTDCSSRSGTTHTRTAGEFRCQNF